MKLFSCEQTGELVSDDVVQQAKQVLTNLSSVLEAAGSSLNNGIINYLSYSQKPLMEKTFANIFGD